MQLIPDGLIDKYVLKRAKVKNKDYNVVFRYTGEKNVDADILEIGFYESSQKEKESVSYLAHVYLPTLREDGMMQRNHVLQYPLRMVLPPVSFTSKDTKRPRYLTGIVSPSIMANRLSDFIPDTTDIKPGRWSLNVSPLMLELLGEGTKDIENLWNWNIFGADLLLIELFNVKILKDIERSTRSGFRGLSTRNAMHSFIRAMAKYRGREETVDLNNQLPSSVDEEEILLGSVSYEDRKGMLYLHPLVSSLNLRHDSPIDFCTCSSSQPILTARLKDGVHVDHVKMKGAPTFPYATFRRAFVGIMSDDPKRVITSRAITRSLKLESPDEPYAETDVKLGIDSVSLPGTRIAHPLTAEDGIIVSRSFANKTGAFSINVQTFSVTDKAEVMLIKDTAFGIDDMDAARSLAKKALYARDVYVIRERDPIAVTTWKNTDGTVGSREIRANNTIPSVLLAIRKSKLVGDLEEETTVYRIVTMSYHKLEVGDKLSDAHGNKGTVSAIWEDDEMPAWEGMGMKIKLHYISNPYTMKRLALGAEIEDKLALQAFVGEKLTGERLTVVDNSLSPTTMKEVDERLAECLMSYTGRVMIHGTILEEAPLCLRRIFRLDNIARKSLVVRTGITSDEYGRTSFNTKLSLEIVSMLARGAGNLANSLIQSSMAKKMVRGRIIPLLHAFKNTVPEEAQTFKIINRLPKELLRGPISTDILASILDKLEGTSADPRLCSSYGTISEYTGGKAKTMIVPPHQPITELGNGTVMISRLALAANRALTEILSERMTGEKESSSVDQQILRYRFTISSLLSGKDGLIRNTVQPVFPHSILAVASAYDADDPMTIMIPQDAFIRLVKSSEDVSRLYNQSRGTKYVLLKRDPVHRVQSVIAVKFKLWKNSTIGVSPLLIKALDGDFDGDKVVAMFPETTMAVMDLQKLAPSYPEIHAQSKQIWNSTAETAVTCLRRNIFTSTSSRPHESDTLKNQQLFDLLSSGATHEDIEREAIIAARNFETIKTGTAATGAVALRFIYTRAAEDATILADAMEMYHVMAQNTLDAKSGEPPLALDIVNEFYRCSPSSSDRIREAFLKLGYTKEKCIEEFIEFSKEVKNARGSARFLTGKAPVMACTQSISRSDMLMGDALISRIADVVVGDSDESLGTGVWEVLFEYLLDRTDKSIYDWSFNINECITLMYKSSAGDS